MASADKPGEGDDLDLIGRTINGYQIIEQIGKGGMAYVYKAHQPSLDRYVALKILPPYYAQQDPTFMARFEQEAKAVAKLRHPNILLVMDYGKAEGIAYIAMEYVEAGTLKERMETPLSLSEISTIIEQIAGALDYAHGKGVIHRDIKPSNIMMPEPNWALLTDFGLARMVTGESHLTQSGMAVGTPTYMSPEQGKGVGIDPRSDIYSLGVMLYELILGEAPYTAETPMAVVVKHITEPLPVIDSSRQIPDAMQRIILKALAKDPNDRYQTAGGLAEALKRTISEAGDWYPSGAVMPRDPAKTKSLPESNGTRLATATLKSPTEDKEPKPGSFTWPVLGGIAGGLAALVVIAVVAVISALVAINLFNNRADARAATSSTQTVVAVAAQATRTPPPVTQTSEPTQTDVPAEPTSLPISGTILYEDDFADPDSGWDRYGDRDIQTDYVDGEYRIRLIDTDFVTWSTAHVTLGAVSIEVDAYLFEGTEENGYGLICALENDDNLFQGVVSSDGYFEVWQLAAGEWVKLSAEQSETSDVILGGDAVNHIRMDCIGDTITLFANGELLTTITLSEALPEGDVGVYAEGFDEGPLEIRFDNFVVTQP
jgi:serine/threonine protein kinase